MVGRQAFPFGFRPIFRGKLLVSGRVHLQRYHLWLCFRKMYGIQIWSPVAIRAQIRGKGA